MKLFIVGGTGALGRAALQALVAAGHDVRATARGPANATLVRDLGGEPVDGDAYDVEALRRAMRGCDAVLRLTTKLAGPVARVRTKAAWAETNRLRAVGTERILEAARAESVGTFVQESFFCAYAGAGDRWVDEDCPSDDGGLEPMQALLEAERAAQGFAAAGGRAISLRFGGFYSAGDAASQQVLALLRKRSLPLLGPGDFYFAFVHLDDAATAVRDALNAPSGVYNVGDDDPPRWRDYLRTVAEAAGAPPPLALPGFLAPLAIGYPWRWMSRSVRLSNRRFKSVTGWQPRFATTREGWRAIAATQDR